MRFGNFDYNMLYHSKNCNKNEKKYQKSEQFVVTLLILNEIYYDILVVKCDIFV